MVPVPFQDGRCRIVNDRHGDHAPVNVALYQTETLADLFGQTPEIRAMQYLVRALNRTGVNHHIARGFKPRSAITVDTDGHRDTVGVFANRADRLPERGDTATVLLTSATSGRAWRHEPVPTAAVGAASFGDADPHDDLVEHIVDDGALPHRDRAAVDVLAVAGKLATPRTTATGVGDVIDGEWWATPTARPATRTDHGHVPPLEDDHTRVHALTFAPDVGSAIRND